jgi:hypothetical protein
MLLPNILIYLPLPLFHVHHSIISHSLITPYCFIWLSGLPQILVAYKASRYMVVPQY